MINLVRTVILNKPGERLFTQLTLYRDKELFSYFGKTGGLIKKLLIKLRYVLYILSCTIASASISEIPA